MKNLFALAVLVGSGYFMYQQYQDKIEDYLNPPAVAAVAPLPPKPVPAPLLNEKQLVSLRQAVFSGDQTARWAAMQSLYTLGDPRVMLVLENAMRHENDPAIRVGIVLLLKTSSDPQALRILKLGVNDVDATVRVASLRVIGEVADLAATPIAAEAVNDVDSDVKVEAMNTLALLQARRRAKYDELAKQLRDQYEEQVKKASEKDS